MTQSRQIERFTSAELGDLMAKVQELLEANVIAMVLLDSTDRVSVTCPPGQRAQVTALLRAFVEQWDADATTI